MAKDSAHRMIIFIATALLSHSVWAEESVTSSNISEDNVLAELTGSIKPMAYRQVEDEIVINRMPGIKSSNGKLEIDLKNMVNGRTLGLGLTVDELHYNSETKQIELKKKTPYSLEEYLRNGKLSYNDGFLSETQVAEDCLPKYDMFQNFIDVVGEVDKCFAKKPSTIDKGVLSQDQLFQMDQDVCQCLYNVKNAGVTSIMNYEKNRDHGARTDAMMKNDIKKRMMDMAAKASALQDGMMFQSHLLYHDPANPVKDRSKDPTLKYGTPFVSQIFQSGGDAQNYLVGRSGEAANLAMNLRGSNQNTNKRADAKLEEQLKKEIGNISIENKSVALLSESEFKPGQCVSAKEYFSYKQFPDSSLFYKSLMNEKSFDPKKWDYIALEKDLKVKRDTIPYTEQSKREMEEIREKLRFLHRNPMLKTLMAANHDFDEYAKKTKTLTKEMKEILEKTSRNVLDHKKKSLFDLVKKHFTPSNPACVNEQRSSCQEDVLKNVKSFDDDMKNFFNDQDVALLTKVQAEKSTFHLIDEFIENPIPQEKVPLKQGDLENFVFNEVINVDQETKVNNFINPGECRAVESSYSSRSTDDRCVQTYAVYCPVVKKAQLQLARKMHRNEVLPNGEEKVKSITYKNYFEPDIDKNEDFKSFNDAFCSIPRKGNDGKQNISFNSFRDSFCKKNRGDRRCKNRSYDNIMALRKVFEEDHGEAVVAGGATTADIDMVNNAIRLNKSRPTSNRTEKDAKEIANSDAGIIRDVKGLERFVNDLQSFGESATVASTVDKGDKFESAGMLSNLTNVVETAKLSNSPSTNTNSYSEDFSNYSNLVRPQEITEADREKVDRLPRSTKEELLGQWREELNEFKRNNESSSTAGQDSEAGLKAKIAALETLLEQQRKLTDDQYKILNNAISNQQTTQLAQVAQNNPTAPKQSEEDFQEKVKVRSASGFTTMGSHGGNLAEDTFRGPASVKESQFNTGGNGGGASASVQRSSSSSGAVSSSSSDSLDREQAKLVNLRRHADGSITIDTSTKGSQFSPNAITLPVSDEQYRLLQSNPGALNLSQIEKSIPKDQLEKLEKIGEIILVLQNGENPPFEIKVEKKDNQLVYQVRDNNGQKINPVRRVYTREALELELKVQ